MKNQNENAAVSDVTARMRTEAGILSLLNRQSVGVASVAKKLREFADSIDAALKSEREAWEEAAVRCVNEVAVAKSATTTGNAAAMREALSDACYAMFNFLKTQTGGFEEMANALDKAKSALSAPPRNCDVGTAEEQDKRFTYQFCRVGIEGCIRCKLNTLKHRGNTCGIHWAQMPYEEGGAK